MGVGKIVLITTGQPSINPRIVKEADTLTAAGYKVCVLFCFWISWASNADLKLLKGVKWNYKLVGGSPDNNLLLLYFTKTRHKLNRILNRYIGNGFLIAERAQSRVFDELVASAQSLKANWYIGHNLGSLPIVVAVAKKNKARCGFDFEDYHRQENVNMRQVEKRRITYLEEKYCRQLDYISTSSPEISKVVKSNLSFYKQPVITLLNCFPLSQQPPFRRELREDNSLHLFWFSQTIGRDRGLEELLQALKVVSDPKIYLTLAGNLDPEFGDYIRSEAGNLYQNIIFAGVIQPEHLPAFAARFDVGLAIERPVPENRNICLTNKIFTYLLAGNAIILSETKMQDSFNKKFGIGQSFSLNDADSLANKIKYYQNKELLHLQRLHNYKLAKENMNWEVESQKFLKIFD